MSKKSTLHISWLPDCPSLQAISIARTADILGTSTFRSLRLATNPSLDVDHSLSFHVTLLSQCWQQYDRAFKEFDAVYRFKTGMVDPFSRHHSTDSRQGSVGSATNVEALPLPYLPPDAEDWQTLHEAWFDLIFAYDQVATAERRSWPLHSDCRELRPYLRSFVQVLERDYQLVKGWELPDRYRLDEGFQRGK